MAILLLTACLDESPRDRLDEDEAMTNSNNIFLYTVANLYNYIGGNSDSQGLQGTSRGVYDLCTFTSDEAILPIRGGDWYDGGLWNSLYMHTFDAGTGPIGDTWTYLYKVIMLCNQSLYNIEKYSLLLTVNQMESYTAEVKALQAMYYYYLLDLYGNVPYVTLSTPSLSNITQIKRSELFHNIWKELTDALPGLANECSNTEGEYYGRMTRHVAWFLLAKMALNAEIWTHDDWTTTERPQGKDIMLDCEGHQLNAWEACSYWCDKLEAAGYWLEDNYLSNFAIHNEESRENIFVIPANKNLYSNIFVNLFRSRHYNHGLAYGLNSENGTCATISAVKTYGYGTPEIDLRYYLNFYSDTVYVDGKNVYLDNGEPLVYMPLEAFPDISSTRYEDTAGARMAKYEVDRTAYADGRLQDNDIVLFRFADVLLMKAEALVRNGQDGSTFFNLVRERVNMPQRPCTLDNILDERLMELQWEGWRRQDLIRFDRFHKPYDQRPQLASETDRHTIVFPIPAKAISLNPKLVQNPGY